MDLKKYLDENLPNWKKTVEENERIKLKELETEINARIWSLEHAKQIIKEEPNKRELFEKFIKDTEEIISELNNKLKEEIEKLKGRTPKKTQKEDINEKIRNAQELIRILKESEFPNEIKRR